MKKITKILSLALVIALACGMSVHAADVVPGDVNGDGSVNSADAIYLLRHTILAESYPVNQSADMNGDGNINSADAIYLLRHTILEEQYPLKNGVSGCDHEETVLPAKAPTCTESGLTEGQFCGKCNAVLVKQETLPALGHRYENGVCSVCAETAKGSEGLAYTLSEDGTYYIVSGLGDCTDTDIVIPAEYEDLPVRTIGEYAFYQNTSVKSIYVSEGVREIRNSAFHSCAVLTSVYLPDSVTAISAGAFSDCTSLAQVTLSNALTKLENAIFYNCYALESIEIPAGVQSIESSAFVNCIGLKEVLLPESIGHFGASAFSGCTGLETVTFAGSEAQWLLIVKDSGWNSNIGAYSLNCLKQPTVANDLLFTVSNSGAYYIVSGIGACKETDIIIPSVYNGLPVLEIGEKAFYNIDTLVSVKVEEGLRIIGAQAFSSCDRLVFADIVVNSVTEIGARAFAECGVLRSVGLPNGLTALSEGLFESCFSLQDISLPNTLTTIGARAFASCTALERLPLPRDLQHIGESAFASCLMESIELPNGLQSIGESAFYGCRNLKDITILDGVVYVGAKAFYECTSLESVALPGSMPEIAPQTFAYCIDLTTVLLPNGIASIGDGAFQSCASLSEIVLPASLEYLGKNVFYGIGDLAISYEGTRFAWLALEKASDWDSGLTYTVSFMDAGDQTKDIYDPKSYGTSYAYDYLGTRPKGQVLQQYYDMMDSIAYTFHISNREVNSMLQEFGLIGLLDFSTLGLTADEANGVWVAYKLDHPLYYWIANSVALSDTTLYFLVAPEYVSASERTLVSNTLYAKISEWTSLVKDESSAYNTALAYHDLILSEIDYAYEADGSTPKSDLWAHTVIGVLGGKGEAVCEGYAKTFQLLLNYSGIENVYVNGYANGPHAWNMVKLDDGQWYWCDLTWDDDPARAWGIWYYYFCVGSTQNINWYYQDGGYIVDSNEDGVLDHEVFTDSHIPDTVNDKGMAFAYPLPSVSYSAYDGTLRDTFVVNDMTYAVSGYRTVQFVYTAKNGNVSIPETVTYDGVTYTVTSIGGIHENGIYSRYPVSYNAHTIFIPKTVKYIWDGAFGADVSITVDAENPYYYSENGTLYVRVLYIMRQNRRAASIPGKPKKTLIHAVDQTK